MCGQDCKLMRNTEPVLEEIEQNNPDGIVFSPGPMRPENHPLMFDILKKYHATKPILGICLGHQAIGEFFGGSLLKAPKPVHGKVSEISHTGHAMYAGIPQSVNVARYHSLALAGLQDTALITTATTKDGLPMSLAHKTLPVWGLQFHPEAIQTEYGLQMLKNWTSIFA
jgi:anthranilate synthase component 2